ncbi:MAG: nicotinamide mononucleotide transporter [Clostridia bacterium]|nr:nicotinamide mononucleotide transporter [Clostridia bacterium]
MKKQIWLFRYFSRFELCLWIGSLLTITLFFFLFDRSSPVSLIASLVGVTAIIFCAKGNPIGQGLMIIFAVLYAFISISYAYYGELMTYVGMSLPMAVFSLISWMRNPYKGNKAEVKVSRLSLRDGVLIGLLSVVVTVVFYFLLKWLGTANLWVSTFSVTTSFIAALLTYRRSPWFALAYAANDVVLIILWSLAMLEDPSYISVTVCFAVFLANDLYSFVNWRRMQKRQ